MKIGSKDQHMNRQILLKGDPTNIYTDALFKFFDITF